MEIIELDTSVVLRGERRLVVGHSLTNLTRGLEQGEPVLLRGADGEHYAGLVRGIEFELDDTIYTFEVGARLPEDLALERAEGLDPRRHDLGLHEIVDLLADLRDASSDAGCPER